MDIQSLGMLNGIMIQENTTTAKNAENDFRQLFEKITGGELAREIRDNYNVTLNVGNIVNCDQFLETNELRGTNHVIISPATLSKMENDSVLKEKVLNDIEEFCSPENQAEIRALQPPVKSAGMIVYPDGRTLYWIEGYPNEIGSEKSKKNVNENSISELLQMYSNADNQMLEKDLSTFMQIMATGYKRQDRNVL
ncbi:MAG: hypothetical protein K2N51_05345 [Lachnospiraceae bacterium]|nr:hypothetical protein [Lachnospiraceae bacterium]